MVNLFYQQRAVFSRVYCPECELAERRRLRVRDTTSIQGLPNSGGLR